MTDEPDNSSGSQDGRDPRGRWKPGVSGNPAGPPSGSRHRTTKAVESLLDGQAEALTQKVVQLALDGDPTALRLCLERILPPRRERPLETTLPPIEKSSDLPRITARLIEAVASGELAPSEGEALSKLVEAHRKIVETAELEERISRLEQRNPRRM
ncbi:MAG: DUF5681 domain-containing protein [Pseudomonadota bacterium]